MDHSLSPLDLLTETPAAFGSRQGRTVRQVAPSRSRRRTAESTGPDGLLPIYLNQMGASDLIGRDEEIRLAKDLDEARRELVKLARRTPAALRPTVLPSSLRPPARGHEWPLEHLEAFCDRLARQAQRSPTQDVAALEREVRRAKRRYDRAREALVNANLRLVVHIAKRYCNNGLPLMDLIQEGNIGLMKAVEKFDYRRENKFSTYAYWWIKQAVDRAISEKARIIRLPVYIRETRRRIHRSVAELAKELGRQPAPREIAARLGLTVKRVREALDTIPDPQSLEAVAESERGLDLLQRVEDPNGSSPFDETSQGEARVQIEAILRTLTPREQRVIRLRFGMGSERSHTLEEIGKKISLSRERVRQVEQIALGKLRQHGVLSELFDGLGSS